MELIVASRSLMPDKLKQKYPGYELVDLTSKGPLPWQRFSPFFPHGDIPVPFSNGVTSQTVEGIWQGLKVFENAPADFSKFRVSEMVGLKRTTRKFGNCIGHLPGVPGGALLDYVSARMQIFLPSYRWILENRVRKDLSILRQMAERRPLLLLDYETNGDVTDVRKPLSHVWLVKHYLEDTWPVLPE